MLLLFPALALVSPVLEAFGTLSIPLFTQPSLIFTGTIAALGLVLGAAVAAALPNEHSGRLRHVVYVGILVGIALVTLDIAGGGYGLLSAIAPARMGRIALLVAVGLVLFGAIWPLRRRAAGILFVASAAFFASTVGLNPSVFATGGDMDPLPRPSRAQSDLPPLVYILVDAAMGVEGLKGAPGGAALAGELRGMFERHGFRVYGSAFSRHFVSSRSIPNALNFDFHDDSWGPHLRHHKDGKVGSALFESLALDGYEVVSYGTEHIDFCFPVAARCEILPSFNPFSPYLDNVDLQSKALYHLVWKAFAESYLLYRYGALMFSRMDPSLVVARFDAHAFPRWFERFERDLMNSPRGRAYFAHLLMPHAPYVFDETCRETGSSVTAFRLGEEGHLSGQALEHARAAGYLAYERQYRCLLMRLDDLLTRIDAQAQFKDATVVVHGDHGARISAGHFAENLSARDLVDNYSALYAIRRPDVEPGYDLRKTSVQRLTAEYFSAEEELGPDNLTVAIDSRQDGNIVVHPMPDFAVAVDR